MKHPKVSESLKINAPASGIWNRIKSFDRVEDYSGGMISHSEVKGQGVGCEVTWESYFDAEESQVEEINSMLQGMIKMNLEGIKNLF